MCVCVYLCGLCVYLYVCVHVFVCSVCDMYVYICVYLCGLCVFVWYVCICVVCVYVSVSLSLPSILLSYVHTYTGFPVRNDTHGIVEI